MTASAAGGEQNGRSTNPGEPTYTVTFGRTLVGGLVIDDGLTFPVNAPTLAFLQRAATPLSSNPVCGEYSASLVRGNDSNGEYEQLLTVSRPGNVGLPEHAHPHGEEHVEVVEGEVVVERGGAGTTLRQGESTTIEVGMPHTVRNESPEVASWLAEMRPADGLEATLTTLGGLAHDGKLRLNGSPGLLQTIVLADAVGDDIVFTSMSAGLQRSAARVIASLTQLFGSNAFDADYGDTFWIAHVEQPPDIRRTP